MLPIKVNTRSGPVAADLPFPDNLDDAIATYGKDKVYSLFRARAAWAAKNAARNMAKNGTPSEQIALRLRTDWRARLRIQTRIFKED